MPRKSIISRRIGRKIQTAPFESLEVAIEVEDEIEWDTMEERDSKMANHLHLATSEFHRSFDFACSALGLSEKRGTVKVEQNDGSIQQGAIDMAADDLGDQC